MQNKEMKVRMTCFMLPTEIILESGIQEADSLEITATAGKIVIERINEEKFVCDGDCDNCPIADDECDGDCKECPCFDNCNKK